VLGKEIKLIMSRYIPKDDIFFDPSRILLNIWSGKASHNAFRVISNFDTAKG